MTAIQQALGFDTGRVRRDDPVTSREAAAKVDVPRRCAEVLSVLRRLGRGTAREVAMELLAEGSDWAMPNVVSRRLLDLERRNLATEAGEVIGRFGRPVFVYEATEVS